MNTALKILLGLIALLLLVGGSKITLDPAGMA